MALSDDLIETSLHAALSAIELYNKPDFKYREQVFTILCINAWELLLKSKIVKDANESITSIYIPVAGGAFKVNRTNNPMTIEIIGAMHKLQLDAAILSNIEALIEIRDTAIHFYHTQALSYIVFSLGVAALKNYQSLISLWFGRNLLDYNFYILPLAFAYNFKTLTHIDVGKEPHAIANIIRAVSSTQVAVDQSNGYYFACEIATEVKSAKKYSGDADFVTLVDPNANSDTAIFIQTQRPIDKYPLTYRDIQKRVKAVHPHIKERQLLDFIRDHGMKRNLTLCTPTFVSKNQEQRYLAGKLLEKDIMFIYNEDALRYIIETIILAI
ncbi:MAG: DUF3644 domain-containing protein [Chloroflexota bacterium]